MDRGLSLFRYATKEPHPNLYVENITRTAPPVMAVIPPAAGGGRYLLPARRAVFLSMAKEDPPLYFRLLDHLGQTEGGCNLVFAQGQRPHLNLRPDLSPRRKSALEQTCLVIGQMLQLRKDEWPKDPQGQASAAN